MAFIQPCFIRKNTPELRKKLEELGYKPCFSMSKYPEVHKNIAVCNFFGDRYYGLNEQDILYSGDINDAINNGRLIDCGTNEDLFLALASMTDNECGLTDYYTITGNSLHYEKGSLHMALPLSSTIHPSCYRKATVEEIIEHFI